MLKSGVVGEDWTMRAGVATEDLSEAQLEVADAQMVVVD